MPRALMLLVALLLASPAQLLAAETPVVTARVLYLVRHGHHSTEPVADPVQGPPLTPAGLDQAKLVAKRLRESGYAIDTVLASPMVRSQQTAQAIVDEVKGARLDSLQDLTECTPPLPPAQMTGLMSAAELQACAEQFDRVYAAYFRPAEGAESAQVLVAHANVIRYLVTRALGMDARNWQQFSISHGSVTTVRIAADGSIVLLGVGDIGHVPTRMRSGSIIDVDSGSRRHR